ncbi:hypothetical protein SD074_05410 [Prolixibacter sp. SD074]|nr:hypothetical protein SD074_05410 [Prolixibacter sp. SD074]
MPVRLVYYEEYARIDDAFYREKQEQGWSRKKKEALINGNMDMPPELAKAYRDKGGSGKMKGAFENLTHPKDNQPLPEALEGNAKNKTPMSEWKTYKLDNFLEINPSESIPKEIIAKKNAMEVLQPFSKKISAYRLEELVHIAVVCILKIKRSEFQIMQ